jgi:hypothetical protein
VGDDIRQAPRGVSESVTRTKELSVDTHNDAAYMNSGQGRRAEQIKGEEKIQLSYHKSSLGPGTYVSTRQRHKIYFD